MRSKGARLLIVAATTTAITAAAGARIAAPPNNAPELNMSDFDVVGDNPAARGPNVGLICIWAIHAALAEIGRRCGVAPSPAVQAELDSGVSRIETYARTRSPDRAAYMESYKQQQIIGDAELCSSDMVDALRHGPQDVDAGVARARRDIDELLARSPPVEWGDTCV